MSRCGMRVEPQICPVMFMPKIVDNLNRHMLMIGIMARIRRVILE